jgi:hypothetical protein
MEVEMAKKLEVRTQIYLEKSQHEALKQKAAEKSTSMAQIIREAVAVYLAQSEEDDDFDWEAYKNDPIWKIREIAEELGPSGIVDGSINHDHYLYGFDKVEENEERGG